MKQPNNPFIRRVLFTCLFAFTLASASSQQYLTKINGMNAYVHLPDDYNTGKKKYPVIIFISGIGEVGTNASKMLSYGPSYFIAKGHKMQFTVNGVLEKPIVISYQPRTAWPVPAILENALNYIERHWRVDKNRIYLTGISMGGCAHNVFVSSSAKNAKRPAAIVSMSAPPTNYPLSNYSWYAGNGGKWWGIEGMYDQRGNKKTYAALNGFRPGSAKYTTFRGGHCCWNSFYDPRWTEKGESIYTWMLKQKLGNKQEKSNEFPIVNAGTDITIRLPLNTVTLNARASDHDGQIKSLSWSKVNGPGSYNIVSARSARTLINKLVSGVYEFQVSATDNDGAMAQDRVKVTVVTAPPKLDPVLAKSKDRILIDFGDLANSTPDRWGKFWNKVRDGRKGVRTRYLSNVKNVRTPVGFEVVNRIDGNYDVNGTGMNREGSTSDVGDYPAVAVNDNAYAHNSTSKGRWRIFGLSKNNEYRIKFWGTRATTAPRIMEIRLANSNVWERFNAQKNRDYNEAAYFKISGVTEVSFELRVAAGSVFGNISLIDIAVFDRGSLNGVKASTPTAANEAADQQAPVEVINPSHIYKPGLSVYPNPAQGDVNISVANVQTGPVTTSILNQAGVVLKTFKFVKDASYLNQRLSLPGLPRGTYFIRVNMRGFNEVKPFVKL